MCPRRVCFVDNKRLHFQIKALGAMRRKGALGFSTSACRGVAFKFRGKQNSWTPQARRHTGPRPPPPRSNAQQSFRRKKTQERITALGRVGNSGSLSLQRLTPPPGRPGEAVTGTRSALFLLPWSNLRKPRVRKHKVLSKLVNRPLKRSQQSQHPGDKVPRHYHSIDSRDFAYLTGNFTLLF